MNCPPTATVCQACKTLLVSEVNVHDDKNSLYTRELYRDRQSLKRSADEGCFLCGRIWDHFVPLGEETAPNYKDPPSPQDKPKDEWPLGLMLLHQPRQGHCYQLRIHIDPSLLCSSQERRSDIFFRLGSIDGVSTSDKKLPESTKSPETLSMAEEWISDCLKNHKRCRDINIESNWYPTRLLDCGPQTDTDPRCTLIKTRTNDITGPYMTLSHCWGLADCMKLTTDNYSTMVGGMPSSQLPLLYQDAVHVTRRLGVRYLWIDSLCIIQKGDDLSDWNREVTLMSQVYSRALCNISAGDAPDATHSLFCTRSANSYFPETIECSFDGVISNYVAKDHEYWISQVTESLVNTRAWVLQERLLAHRVLHFGRRHLIWECREGLATDTSPEGLPNSISSFPLRLKSLFPPPGQSSRHYSAAWWPIVYLYANCSLTFPGDRLVALSALARTMGSLMQQGYVAGMWRDSLELEMLWWIDSMTKAPILTTYRAPTWSWVASTGKLFPGEPTLVGQSHIKVEKVQLDYATEDTWGMLRGGWLHLRGHLKKVSLIRSGDWKLVVDGVQVEVETDDHMQLRVYLDTPNDEADKVSELSWYCMLARTVRKIQQYVLLLELVDGETGTFKRVGLAGGEVKDAQATFLSPSEREDEFPCLEYSDGQHLICII